MALHERLTPSGTTIHFEDGLDGKRRTYWLGERTTDNKVPSITTVLGCMEKEGLHYAIEKLAVHGAITLATSDGLPSDVPDAMEAMKSRGLTFRQQWGRKADKGTDIHDYLERLLTDPAAEVPYDCEPFANAIRAWHAEHDPMALQSEVMVCSTKHRFAGRFDLLCYLPEPKATCRVELKSTDKIRRRDSGEPYPPYTENFWQLAAQELAAVESGDPASDLQAVLRVDEQGAFDFCVTQVEPRGFLAALSLYRALRNQPEPNQQLTMEAEAA